MTATNSLNYKQLNSWKGRARENQGIEERPEAEADDKRDVPEERDGECVQAEPRLGLGETRVARGGPPGRQRMRIAAAIAIYHSALLQLCQTRRAWRWRGSMGSTRGIDRPGPLLQRC